MMNLKTIAFLVLLAPVAGFSETPGENPQAETEAVHAMHSKDCCFNNMVDQNGGVMSPQEAIKIVDSDTQDLNKTSSGNSDGKADAQK